MPNLRTPDSPRLPQAFNPFDDDEFDGAYQMRIEGAFAEADLEHAEIEQCLFSKANLAGAAGSGATLVDCEVQHSDLANVALEGSGLRRVLVTDSRLTGLSFLDGVARDVLVQDSKVDLTNWRATTFTNVHCLRCDLTRADFAMSDLRGAQFTDCTLIGAQFSNAKASGARFARCELSGIGGVTALAGATIQADDLAVITNLLAEALGITIEL
jgi:uncharacterized protein YjbI with pentapeptide repeats